jgi:hypothetical protein
VASGANCVEHEEEASGLTIYRAGHKSLSARRTLDTIKIDAPHIGGRNQSSTFWTDGIERRLHLVEINFPRAWHWVGVLFIAVLRNGIRPSRAMHQLQEPHGSRRVESFPRANSRSTRCMTRASKPIPGLGFIRPCIVT